ncbi:hypothetical protein [Oceanisphaera sp. IT1-181]|uniref:hypothetical protein n=1 Tax=Oceanisphaera sp. IT1-181 TaxID=3081199 RepID=UPI0029CA123A|nr:hypothetical protein [Oceanisphaera sp. IT1-181]
MTVLHINSSARLSNSNTRIIGQYLVDALAEPTLSRDLAQHPLPTINAEDLMAVHSSLRAQRGNPFCTPAQGTKHRLPRRYTPRNDQG